MEISLGDIMDQNEREKGQPKPPKTKLATIRYDARPEGVKKLTDLPPATPEQVKDRIAPFRKIVAESQAHTIAWYDHTGKRRTMRCDGFMASAVVQVADAMKPEQLAVICALEPPGIVNMAWRILF